MFHSKVETDGKSLNAENQVFKRGNEEPPTQSAKKNKLPALSSADLQQNDGSESFERALFEKGLLPIETGKVTDDSEWTVDAKDLLDVCFSPLDSSSRLRWPWKYPKRSNRPMSFPLQMRPWTLRETFPAAPR
ncbi:hypothetical protein WA588_002198 [Blastocystis sp. NMH]